MNPSLFTFLLLVFLSLSCNSPTKNNKETLSVIDTTDKARITTGDTIINKSLVQLLEDTLPTQTDKAETTDVTNWETDDFIVHKKDRSNAALRRHIEYEREQWKKVKNPLVAIFRDADMGDYFHLVFEDDAGKTHDFGFGNNNYGKIILFDPKDMIANPDYLGKSFRVYWSWKISSFPCCDGENELVEAWLPGITRLELAGAIEGKK